MRPPQLRCKLFPPYICHTYFSPTKVIVIRLRFILQAYLSETSLICDFCPSDQGVACRFFQILSRDKHPCCSAIHFPLSGHVRDFHPLEFAHAGQTKIAIIIILIMMAILYLILLYSYYLSEVHF